MEGALQLLIFRPESHTKRVGSAHVYGALYHTATTYAGQSSCARAGDEFGLASEWRGQRCRDKCSCKRYPDAAGLAQYCSCKCSTSCKGPLGCRTDYDNILGHERARNVT